MQLEIKENTEGFLIPLYLTKICPFPKRIFFIKNKKPGDIRGKHAHFKDSQKLILLNGKAIIKFENAATSGIVELNFGQMYESRPLEWLEITLIESNTIIAVLSQEEYNEEEYIRDYSVFKQQIL